MPNRVSHRDMINQRTHCATSKPERRRPTGDMAREPPVRPRFSQPGTTSPMRDMTVDRDRVGPAALLAALDFGGDVGEGGEGPVGGQLIEEVLEAR